MAQLVKNPPAMWENWVQSLGWEDPLEKGKATPVQYSGLENSRDCIARRVAKSRTHLSHFHFQIRKGPAAELLDDTAGGTIHGKL